MTPSQLSQQRIVSDIRMALDDIDIVACGHWRVKDVDGPPLPYIQSQYLSDF